MGRIPEWIPEKISEFMKQCWKGNAKKRPSSVEIEKTLKAEMVTEHRPQVVAKNQSKHFILFVDPKILLFFIVTLLIGYFFYFRFHEHTINKN